MIFLGNGSLLKKALLKTLSLNYRIDYVLSHSAELSAFCSQNMIPFKVSIDYNDEADIISQYCSDGFIFSIDNGQILGEMLLSLPGVKFYNIHNGLIPSYRGNPAVCIFFALINGEKDYGVSLHEIDAGIDTGKCLKQLHFLINDTDTFQDIMLKGIQYCEKIFEESLEDLINGSLPEIEILGQHSKLYSQKDLACVSNYRESGNLNRALKFGIFRLYFPKIYSTIISKLVEH